MQLGKQQGSDAKDGVSLAKRLGLGGNPMENLKQDMICFG